MDNKELKLVIALTKSYNLFLSKITSQLASYDLSVSEFGVLELLFHKGKQPIQKIAEKILVTSGTMTYVINQLIKKGYVKRRQCENDLRITYVELTQEGLSKMQMVFPIHQIYLSTLFQHISDTDQDQLVSLLKSLQSSILYQEGAELSDSKN